MKTILGKVKKGQAAMEFLMTYGWAILVVLVVIGALAYFGVLSPATLLPEKCTFPVSVSCTDHTISERYIALMLQNGAGRDMTIRGVTATGEALVGMCTTVTTGAVPRAPTVSDTCSVASGGLDDNGCTGGATFRNGETKRITMATTAGSCLFKDTGRDKARYNVTVFYSWLDSPSIMHQLPGELLARRP